MPSKAEIEVGYRALLPTLENYPIADMCIRSLAEEVLEAAEKVRAERPQTYRERMRYIPRPYRARS